MYFLTDEILKWFDKGFLTEMILIDHQKAFDTLDHEILLQNLKVIKFSILNVSSQILEKFIVGYHKVPILVFDLCERYARSSQFNFTFIRASCTNTRK